MFKNRFLLIALCISLLETTAMAVREQEDGPAGLVVMEAELYDALVPAATNVFNWEFETEFAGYSAEGYLRSRPGGTNIQSDLDRAPRLDYVVKINQPGTLYIWARVLAPTSAENSIHLGDSGVKTADRINVPEIAQWVWKNVANDGSRARVVMNAPGLITINCWMRESGCCVDKLLLTLDSGYVPDGEGPPESPHYAGGLATSPSPASEATDVIRDTALSWSAGEFAVTHNVYLGLDFNDVNNADESSTLLVGPGLSETTFTPDGPLTFGETYYWRVDAVNDVNPNSPWKGEVWSFEVEPYAYPLAVVDASASSTLAELHSINRTVDRSGITVDANGNDVHSAVSTDMWKSSFLPAPASAWLQYSFDAAYSLHELRIWNANEFGEEFQGSGIKDISIETSLDGDAWTPLGDFVVPQGPGQPDYAANEPIDLGGVEAQHVKLVIHSNWGGIIPQFSVSEVEFSYIPVKAREPQPDNGTTGVDPDIPLSWRSGRKAVSHTITLSTDPETVIETTDNTYDTTALDLQLGESYSWVVTEVNEAATPSVWEGDVWTFTTVEPLVFDDMESYQNKASFMIWETWLDGTEFGTNDPGNGSIVGVNPLLNEYGAATGLGRGKSLPIWFDDTTVSSSEATRFVDDEDWTRHGIESLSLYFRKGADNTGGGQVYVKINDKQVVYQEPADVPPGWQTDQWIQWIIDLSAVGTDLTKVTKITVGVRGANAKGVLYVDDIAFYKNTPASEQVVSWFEAESGTRGPTMMLFDDVGGLGASGGQFIGTEDGSGEDTGAVQMDGIATYSFSVNQAGVYKLMARVGDFGGNSFHVRIPGSVINTTGFQDGWIAWNFDSPDELGWRTLADYNDGNQVVEFTLSAGEHTLEIARREDGAFLDAITIVSVTE